jgi:hypothetical protein
MFAVKERIMVCLMSDETAYVSGVFKIDIHSDTPDRISRAVALMAVIGPRLAAVRLRHHRWLRQRRRPHRAPEGWHLRADLLCEHGEPPADRSGR